MRARESVALASEPGPSNGYDGIVDAYRAARSRSGVNVVAEWIKPLKPGARILDLGAGTGQPLIPVLQAADLSIFALDASPAMVAAFRVEFPQIEVVCEPVEESDFFGRKFEAILAIGLVFLLPEEAQIKLLHRISAALVPGGAVLFSAPIETGAWQDVLTDQTSQSLGEAAYHKHLLSAGFKAVTHLTDRWGSNYYAAQKALP